MHGNWRRDHSWSVQSGHSVTHMGSVRKKKNYFELWVGQNYLFSSLYKKKLVAPIAAKIILWSDLEDTDSEGSGIEILLYRRDHGVTKPTHWAACFTSGFLLMNKHISFFFFFFFFHFFIFIF